MKIEITSLAQLCAQHRQLGKGLILMGVMDVVYWIAAFMIDLWWAYMVAGVIFACLVCCIALHRYSGRRIVRLIKREKELNVYLNELYDRIKPV